MTAMPVHTRLGEYRAAVAQLARSARLVGSPSGAVCVIDGADDWCTEAGLLAEADARTIVVSHPSVPSTDALGALLVTEADIVLVRPRLELALSVAGVAEGAFAVSAQAWCAPVDRDAVGADLLGWLRLLTGAPVDLQVASEVQGTVLAVGTCGARVPVSFTIGRAARRVRPALDALVIAEERTELSLDEASGVRRVATATATVTAAPPRVLEATARAALRRALDVEERERGCDLRDFREDLRPLLVMKERTRA